jgi:hypothetical protein
VLQRTPPGAVGISPGASVEGAEEEAVPANPGMCNTLGV